MKRYCILEEKEDKMSEIGPLQLLLHNVRSETLIIVAKTDVYSIGCLHIPGSTNLTRKVPALFDCLLARSFLLQLRAICMYTYTQAFAPRLAARHTSTCTQRKLSLIHI